MPGAGGSSAQPGGAPADAAPAGMPPGMPPTAPDPDSGPPEVVTPEEKQVLLQLIKTIQSHLQALHATNFASQNKTEVLRRALLQEVFQKLQLAGIDLTDRQSVAKFMTSLQQQNPTVAANFEKAMGALLGPMTGGGFATPQPQQPDQAGDPNEINTQDQYGNQAQNTGV